jgi:hypothetical protein
MIPHCSDIRVQVETLRPPYIRCDTCDEPISVSAGWLEWLEDDCGRAYGLRIVHRAHHGCHMYTDRPNQCGIPLDFFIDAKGIAYWLNRIDQGRVRDVTSVRRMLFRIRGQFGAMSPEHPSIQTTL